MILGTAAYMSPEQARGKAVDTRTDIWAFGCVLYEMLTGRRAFDGEGVSATLARVLEREPDWARLPATLSPALRTYLARCLQKDPRQRVQAIGDVRLALEGAFEAPVSPAAAPVAVTGWRRAALIGVAAVIVGGAIAGSLTWVAMRQQPPRVSRLQVASSGDSEPSVGYNDRDLAITPDGSRLIYIGNSGTQIFVRALDSLEPVAVFTGVPVGLFTSPDGQWIGFTDGRGTLKKVAVTGGPAVTLATLDTTCPSGATWGPDDTIIAATENVATGLQRVSASGGSVDVLTRPDRAQGRSRSPLARDVARRTRRALHDHGADGRTRSRTSGRPGSPEPGRAACSCAVAVTPTTSRAVISSTARPARCGRWRLTWPVWSCAAHR